MKMIMFFMFCLAFVAIFFVLGFNSKKKVYSKRIRRWVVRTRRPSKLLITSVYVIEGIGLSLACVFTGTFTRILSLSLDYAEQDINPFWVLLSVLITTAIFIGIVVYLSKTAYLVGQKRKDMVLSSGR